MEEGFVLLSFIRKEVLHVQVIGSLKTPPD